MAKKHDPDRAPPERQQTARASLEAALRDGPATAKDLSQLCHLSEKDVVQHLEHVRRSLEAKGEALKLEPATCEACEFVFKDRERLTKPSRCPECQSERISPPTFFIELPGAS